MIIVDPRIERPIRLKFRIGPGPLIALIVLYVAISLALAKPGNARLYPVSFEAQGAPQVVYVINNGFHTDLALPAALVAQRGGPLAAAAQSATSDPWVLIGWGDASFYRNSGLSPGRIVDGLRALFMPNNSSVVRIYGLSRDPLTAYAKPIATPIALSPAGFDAMAQRMEQSLTQTAAGAPVRSAAGADPADAYFESGEHFNLLRMCNNWTSDMLSAAGLPTTPGFDGLAQGVMFDLKWRAHATRPR